jgi:hypothetical protein
MKKYSFVIFFILLTLCCKTDKKLNLSLLFQATNLSYDSLDLFAEKYSQYDQDYKKIATHKLFDPWPELNISEEYRVYSQIKTLEQGRRIADAYFHMRFQKRYASAETKYRNMYIYYYYNSTPDDWLYVVILSEHTGEILYYLCSRNTSPIL